jgi:hypothetical protein
MPQVDSRDRRRRKVPNRAQQLEGGQAECRTRTGGWVYLGFRALGQAERRTRTGGWVWNETI